LIDSNTTCVGGNDLSRDVFEDTMVQAKARSFRIKATYAYEILHDQ